MTTAVEAEITAMVAGAFDETIPRKRAVVRSQTVLAMDPETGFAAVTTADAECWALLDEASRSRHPDLTVERRGRPWLLQGLTSAPAPGQMLVVENEGTGATFTHGGASRIGAVLAIMGEPRDMSAGVGALWEVLA